MGKNNNTTNNPAPETLEQALLVIAAKDAEIAEHESTIATHGEDVIALNAAIGKLEESLDQKDSKIDELSKEAEQKDEVIAELNSQLSSTESKSKSISKPTIKIGKKVYTINSGACVASGKYTASQLAENADAAEEV